MSRQMSRQMSRHLHAPLTRLRRATAVVGVALMASCSISDSSSFSPVPDEEFPAALRETIPPTTTTTTIPETTTTIGSVTTSSVPTEVIQVFFIQGSRVKAVSLSETSPVSTQRKLLDLVERVGMISPNLRLATVINENALLLSKQERGVVTIELGSAIDAVIPEDQPLFFAQIVLTVLAPSRLGQVVFTRNGEPYPAVRADQTVLEPGAPVAWEDYSELIIGDLRPPVSTTTSIYTPVN